MMEEEKVRISFSISKSLLDDFDKVSKENGHQDRQRALIDLIEKEVDKKNLNYI